jgi:hypothetical protein
MRRQSCSCEAFHRTAICERHFVCPRSSLAAAQTTAQKKTAPSRPSGTCVSPTSPGMADREPKLETQHHDAVMPSGGHAFLKRANSRLVFSNSAHISPFYCLTEAFDVDDDPKSPGGSVRSFRAGTVTSDNAFLEDKLTEGHAFDASQFERLYLIGKGDVGRVYLCRTKNGGKLCAMKVLDQVRS